MRGEMKRKILKVLGALLGVVWIFFGAYLLVKSSSGETMQIIYGVTFIGTGIYFLSYAFTGRSTIMKVPENRE